MPFAIKRIYEPAEASDGQRVLVDRLWPRGVSKERAALDEWNKDIAPSTTLRKAFGHMAERFPVFREAYLRELSLDLAKQRAAAHLRELGEKGPVTLLYGARDPKINHAVVLKEFLEGRAQ